jgi:hypothetical protein
MFSTIAKLLRLLLFVVGGYWLGHALGSLVNPSEMPKSLRKNEEYDLGHSCPSHLYRASLLLIFLEGKVKIMKI